MNGQASAKELRVESQELRVRILVTVDKWVLTFNS